MIADTSQRQRQGADAILFKDEGPGGPVLVHRNGRTTNYEDHPHLCSPISGKPLARWFTREEASAIAKRERLPLEES